MPKTTLPPSVHRGRPPTSGEDCDDTAPVGRSKKSRIAAPLVATGVAGLVAAMRPDNSARLVRATRRLSRQFLQRPGRRWVVQLSGQARDANSRAVGALVSRLESRGCGQLLLGAAQRFGARSIAAAGAAVGVELLLSGRANRRAYLAGEKSVRQAVGHTALDSAVMGTAMLAGMKIGMEVGKSCWGFCWLRGGIIGTAIGLTANYAIHRVLEKRASSVSAT